MDVKNDYIINILSSHRDPLSRQSTEAVRISRALKSGIHTDPRGKDVKVYCFTLENVKIEKIKLAGLTDLLYALLTLTE